jgi:hypothetical protein
MRDWSVADWAFGTRRRVRSTQTRPSRSTFIYIYTVVTNINVRSWHIGPQVAATGFQNKLQAGLLEGCKAARTSDGETMVCLSDDSA